MEEVQWYKPKKQVPPIPSSISAAVPIQDKRSEVRIWSREKVCPGRADKTPKSS